MRIRKWSDREKVSYECQGESLTEQSHKDACDINMMVARAVRTGVMPQSPGEARFMDCPAMTYHEALETVRLAQISFSALPAQVRRVFDNNPGLMLSAIEASKDDPALHSELVELGILEEVRNAPTKTDEPVKPVQQSKGSAEPKEPSVD